MIIVLIVIIKLAIIVKGIFHYRPSLLVINGVEVIIYFIERQAVLELLALSSCLNIKGDDTVLMIQGAFGLSCSF